MKDPIKNYCKIGIIHFMLYKDVIKGDGDFSSVDVILNDPFFDAIEMTRINDPEARKVVAEKIHKSGKTFGFGAQPVLLTQKLDLNHENPAERQKAVNALFEVIEQAYELSAAGFAVLSGKNVTEDKRPEALKNLVSSLKQVADRLKKYGTMPLILELFDSLPYAKNCLIGSSRDAAQIAREMHQTVPNFGLMLDLSHLPLQSEKPREALSSIKEFLVHAHMGNCIMNKPGHPLNGDEHPPFEDPDGENGADELAEYLSALLDIGFLNTSKRPILSFEVCVNNRYNQIELIKQSKDVLERAWAKV